MLRNALTFLGTFVSHSNKWVLNTKYQFLSNKKNPVSLFLIPRNIWSTYALLNRRLWIKAWVPSAVRSLKCSEAIKESVAVEKKKFCICFLNEKHLQIIYYKTISKAYIIKKLFLMSIISYKLECEEFAWKKIRHFFKEIIWHYTIQKEVLYVCRQTWNWKKKSVSGNLKMA